jgi:zinc transporter ZupT
VAFSIIALVGVHLIPDAVRDVGIWALIIGLLGLFLPVFVERWGARRQAALGTTPALVWMALGGLAAHAFVDGNALVYSETIDLHQGHLHGSTGGQHGMSLAIAVLLHRLPIGLVIGSLLYENHSMKKPLIVTSVMGVATVIGYSVGGKVLHLLPNGGLALFEAFVSGMLLHVVFDHVLRRKHNGLATVHKG